MTSILLLGAGASVAGGYPVTDKLFSTMATEATTKAFVQYREAWSKWEDYRQSLPPALDVIRGCSNPEIVLSLPDLLDAAAEWEDERRIREAVEVSKATGESHHAALEAYFNSDGRAVVSQARGAWARLSDALNWFFLFRHQDDSRKERSSRDYLRTELSRLAPGDAVLTFNWDTLVERTLLEDRRWLPTDGYGFPRNIVEQVDHLPARPLRASLCRPSDIVVLKLHGSFGWRQQDDRLFLDGREYLAGFSFTADGGLAFLRDADEPPHYSPTDLLVAYPSFLKKLATPVLDQIWREAASYLDRAELAHVIGYSLPPSDSAARALLHRLALRVRGREARVVVSDPSTASLGRWKAFLGPEAEYHQISFPPHGSA